MEENNKTLTIIAIIIVAVGLVLCFMAGYYFSGRKDKEPVVNNISNNQNTDINTNTDIDDINNESNNTSSNQNTDMNTNTNINDRKVVWEDNKYIDYLNVTNTEQSQCGFEVHEVYDKTKKEFVNVNSKFGLTGYSIHNFKKINNEYYYFVTKAQQDTKVYRASDSKLMNTLVGLYSEEKGVITNWVSKWNEKLAVSTYYANQTSSYTNSDGSVTAIGKDYVAVVKDDGTLVKQKTVNSADAVKDYFIVKENNKIELYDYKFNKIVTVVENSSTNNYSLDDGKTYKACVSGHVNIFDIYDLKDTELVIEETAKDYKVVNAYAFDIKTKTVRKLESQN